MRFPLLYRDKFASYNKVLAIYNELDGYDEVHHTIKFANFEFYELP